ncbi:MAG: PAS domain-containing protein [Methylococcaceae bacterium]|jgi:PAS domain S-box-containing protein
MFFIAEKDPGFIPQVLSTILDACVTGVTLADPDLPDMPIVYANKAFETISGYAQEEVVGRNCRFLQGYDRDQEARFKIRKAVDDCQPIEVTLRNYRKDGELFYNHLALTPLFDREGKLIYYLGVQYDVTKQVLADEEIKRLSEALETVTRL